MWNQRNNYNSTNINNDSTITNTTSQSPNSTNNTNTTTGSNNRSMNTTSETLPLLVSIQSGIALDEYIIAPDNDDNQQQQDQQKKKQQQQQEELERTLLQRNPKLSTIKSSVSTYSHPLKTTTTTSMNDQLQLQSQSQQPNSNSTSSNSHRRQHHHRRHTSLSNFLQLLEKNKQQQNQQPRISSVSSLFHTFATDIVQQTTYDVQETITNDIIVPCQSGQFYFLDMSMTRSLSIVPENLQDFYYDALQDLQFRTTTTSTSTTNSSKERHPLHRDEIVMYNNVEYDNHLTDDADTNTTKTAEIQSRTSKKQHRSRHRQIQVQPGDADVDGYNYTKLPADTNTKVDQHVEEEVYETSALISNSSINKKNATDENDTNDTTPPTTTTTTTTTNNNNVTDVTTIISAYLGLLIAVIAVSSNGTALSLLHNVHPCMKLFWRMNATSILLSYFAIRSCIRQYNKMYYYYYNSSANSKDDTSNNSSTTINNSNTNSSSNGNDNAVDNDTTKLLQHVSSTAISYKNDNTNDETPVENYIQHEQNAPYDTINDATKTAASSSSSSSTSSVLRMILEEIDISTIIEFLCAVIAFTIHTILYFYAFQYTSIGNAVIFANSQALLIIIAKLCMGQHVLIIEIIGVIIAFTGALLCCADSDRPLLLSTSTSTTSSLSSFGEGIDKTVIVNSTSTLPVVNTTILSSFSSVSTEQQPLPTLINAVDVAVAVAANAADHNDDKLFETIFGDLLALGAAVMGVIYLTFAKAVRKKIKTTTFMFLIMFCGSLLVLLYMSIIGIKYTWDNNPIHGLFGWISFTTPSSTTTITLTATGTTFKNDNDDVVHVNHFIILVYIAIICNICGTMGFVKAMNFFDNLIIAVATLLEPLIATFIAYMFHVGSLPGYIGWIGNFLVAIGTFGVVYPSIHNNSNSTKKNEISH